MQNKKNIPDKSTWKIGEMIDQTFQRVDDMPGI